MNKLLSPLEQDLFALLVKELAHLWEREDTDFLVQLVQDVAREKILMSSTCYPAEHQENLLHLAATLRGEILRKQLKIQPNVLDMFVNILVMVIKTLALNSLKTQL